MKTRSYGQAIALAFCSLLLLIVFFILAASLLDTGRQDFVAASPPGVTPGLAAGFPLETLRSPPANDYAQAIVDYNTVLALALSTINDLAASATIDPVVWAPRLNTSQVALLYAQADLQQVTPPADLLHLHNSMLGRAAQCVEVIDRAVDGLNSYDLAVFQQLAEPLRICRASFDQANAAALQLNPRLIKLPVISLSQPAAHPRTIGIQPPLTPTVIGGAAIFQSGGLGQDNAYWEANFGPSSKNAGFVAYGGFNTLAYGDNIALIWVQWRVAITPKEAQLAGVDLMPTDGELVRTYSPPERPATTVHLYHSAALASRFEAQYFIGGKPGNYTIQYNVFDSQVSSMIIAIGNNP
jgi:hypothetical protein